MVHKEALDAMAIRLDPLGQGYFRVTDFDRIIRLYIMRANKFVEIRGMLRKVVTEMIKKNVSPDHLFHVCKDFALSNTKKDEPVKEYFKWNSPIFRKENRS